MPSGMQQPWLGAVVAVIGLGVLWWATQSLSWIEDATLSEFAEGADWLDQFQVVQWYADWGWKLVTAYVVLVAVLATLVNLTSRLARTLLWLPLVGPFAFFNLTDGKGSAAPRVLGAIAMFAPAAVLGAVLVDLLVEPEFDPPAGLSAVDVEALEAGEIDPEDVNLEDVDPESLPDEESLRQLEELQQGEINLDNLTAVGLGNQGYSTGEIGQGLWASFAGLVIVAVGAIVGTRSPSRNRP